MTLQEDFNAAVATAQAASALFDAVAKGPASGAGSIVMIGGVEVKTIAKAIADIDLAATQATADATEQKNFAREWAASAENVLISASAGGDQVDDFSALHWAAKAQSIFDAVQALSSTFTSIKFKGGWDASTNTPAIPVAAPDNAGHYYVVSAAGTTDIDGAADWATPDWIISNGSQWNKIDNSEATDLIRKNTASVLTAGFAPKKKSLLDGATVTPDFNAGNTFAWVPAADCNLALPTLISGQDAGDIKILATPVADRVITLTNGLVNAEDGGTVLNLTGGKTTKIYIELLGANSAELTAVERAV